MLLPFCCASNMLCFCLLIGIAYHDFARSVCSFSAMPSGLLLHKPLLFRSLLRLTCPSIQTRFSHCLGNASADDRRLRPKPTLQSSVRQLAVGGTGGDGSSSGNRYFAVIGAGAIVAAVLGLRWYMNSEPDYDRLRAEVRAKMGK